MHKAREGMIPIARALAVLARLALCFEQDVSLSCVAACFSAGGGTSSTLERKETGLVDPRPLKEPADSEPSG